MKELTNQLEYNSLRVLPNLATVVTKYKQQGGRRPFLQLQQAVVFVAKLFKMVRFNDANKFYLCFNKHKISRTRIVLDNMKICTQMDENPQETKTSVVTDFLCRESMTLGQTLWVN